MVFTSRYKELLRCHKASAAFLFVLFVLFFSFSYFVPWLGDNIIYGYHLLPGKNLSANASSPLLQPIGSIGEIADSQYNHYFAINGRIVAHCLVQLICAFDLRCLFAFINAGAWILLLLLLLHFAGGRGLKFRSLLSITLLCVLTLITQFTPAYQIGFVWMAVLNLLFLKLFLKSRGKPTALRLIFLFLFSLLAGNGQEAYSILMGAGLLLYAFLNFGHLDRRRIVMGIGYAIGALILCLSPGSRNRVAAQGVSWWLSTIDLLIFCWPVWVAFIMLLRKRGRVIIKGLNLYLWVAVIVGLVFNVAVSVYCNRQLFGVTLVAVLLIIRMSRRHSLSKAWLWILSFLACCMLSNQALAIYKERRDLDYIRKEYVKSSAGKVFFDVTRPVEIVANNFSYIYPIGSTDGNRYLEVSLRKAMSSLRKDSTALLILPTFMQSNELPKDKQVITLPQGDFLLTQPLKDKTPYVIYRSLRGFPALMEDTLHFTMRSPAFRHKGVKATIIRNCDTWFNIDSIKTASNN